jgi:hypothetical protein
MRCFEFADIGNAAGRPHERDLVVIFDDGERVGR